jgi:hypothetical protein
MFLLGANPKAKELFPLEVVLIGVECFSGVSRGRPF